MRKRLFIVVPLVVIVALVSIPAGHIVRASNASPRAQGQDLAMADNPAPPSETLKLVFIHHSCGENWLTDGHGNLGIALRNNNYYVSDTNYGWGTTGIGDNTDIGHWWSWFRGPQSGTILGELYAHSDQWSYYSRPDTDPGGENQIVMFKSCYPNSALGGSPGDGPPSGANPLRGQSYDSPHHTVGNAKGIYNDLLTYFATRQDKLFVVVTAPPLMSGSTTGGEAANARAFNRWLVEDWLDGYPHDNVVVFDFYNVLTSNGGNTEKNDAGQAGGNHHRWWNGTEQWVMGTPNNMSAYPDGDSHPTSAGNQKASDEFVPLLNVYVNRWLGAEPGPTATNTTAPDDTATPTTQPSATRTTQPSATHTPQPGASATPTPTATAQAGEVTITYQHAVSPDGSYAGGRDCILASQAPDVNLGGGEYFEAFYGEGERRRSLLYWELVGIPAEAHIVSAHVELKRYDGDAETEMPVALYRMTGGWLEGTNCTLEPGAGYAPDGATWNLASPGHPWTTPGGDYDTTSNYGHGANGIVDQVTLPKSASGWYSFDVTQVVRGWRGGNWPNYGLLLRGLSGEYTYHYFASREHTSEAWRPKLVVTYRVGEIPKRVLYLPMIIKSN